MAWPAARRMVLLGAVLVALRLAVAWAWPLVLALALASLLDPPVGRLAAAVRLPRALTAALVLGVGVLLGVGLAAWVVAHLVPEMVSVRSLVPTVVRDLRRASATLVRGLGPPGMWPEPLRSALEGETADAGRALSGLAVGALRAVAVLPGLAAGLGLSLVATYLVLVDGSLRRRLAEALKDVPLALEALETVSVASAAAWRLASAELLLAATSACASACAFWLLGASVPLVLGVLAGLLDLIPYAGPAALLLPWAGYLALVGEGGRCLAVLAAWLVLALVRGVLELRWVGRGIGLSTLAVLVSFYVGARLMGLAGILLGPVCAAALWAVWREGRAEAAARPPHGSRAALRGRRRLLIVAPRRWHAG